MNLTSTLIGLVFSVLFFAWANWHQRRKKELGTICLIPTTAIQIISLVAFVVFAAHLLTILTGTTFRGRRGY
ncbi:MAG: hypothetical protein CMM58_08870 [Rhodospirillaceae bacterium]|nr:hypothetical protein [Rhodospirillaceae bacterium]